MKKYWLYIGILVAVTALVVFAQNAEKKPLDWRPTFSRRDKIPYGTYILYGLLPEIFKGQKVEPINKPLYEAMNSRFTIKYDSTELDSALYLPHNYIFINSAESLDSNACIRLLRRVHNNGGNVFMAEDEFPAYLQDTLHFHRSFDTAALVANFVNPALKTTEPYTYKKITGYSVFSNKFDTANTTVLATNQNDSVIMLKIQYGKGAFYLSSVPFVFTNYYLLQNDNHVAFASKTLSYLPLADTYWYEYSIKSRERVALSYILSQTPLLWAFYLLLFGIIAYIIFEGKRKQRVIPIVPPIKNTSLEFAETVGQLYYHHRDHINLARKMISHFYDFVRTRLFIKTNVQDENFYKQIALKTGMAKEELRSLFTNFEQVEMHGQLTEEQLIELNVRLEAFYKKALR